VDAPILHAYRSPVALATAPPGSINLQSKASVLRDQSLMAKWSSKKTNTSKETFSRVPSIVGIHLANGRQFKKARSLSKATGKSDDWQELSAKFHSLATRVLPKRVRSNRKSVKGMKSSAVLGIFGSWLRPGFSIAVSN